MAAAATSPLTPHHLPLLLLCVLLLLPAADAQTTLKITNRCPYTVWPAATPVGGGMRLDPRTTWTFDVPDNTKGWQVWARTGCSFDIKDKGSCQTGDCDGVLACKGPGKQPFTLAGFVLNGFEHKSLFYISLENGLNIPMEFLPVRVEGEKERCRGARCVADITSQCPSELRVPGGCNNTCPVVSQLLCGHGKYSWLFVRKCPEAIIDSSDIATVNTFRCPRRTNYQINFCPSINLTTSPPLLSSKPPSPPDSIAIGPARTGFSPRKLGSVALIALAGSLVSFILVAAFILFVVHRTRTRRHHEMEEEEVEFGKLQRTPMRFTFQQLEVVTEQFKDKLGEGGFGSVFKGRLGEERIAVKRLDRAGQGKREFLAEVQTTGIIHHINLVRLFGLCAEKSHRLVVYEYMPKGSLDNWIYCRHENTAPPLEWRARCKIIMNIAKGLSYLHEDCMQRIAHLDVKPQNILIGDDFNAKISDFGLCKLIDRDMSQVVTRMRGTPGYLAPEWLTSHITEKVDVYSFGVVVMEIVSGRKNLDTCRSEESIHLITLLEEKVKNGHLVDLIDKNSKDMQAHEQDVIQMMKLAMWCLQIDCKRRPKMSEVVKVLEGTMDAESKLDHNFVATNQANFGIAANVTSLAAPLASHLSGPR
ncbi:G-type lectin S-receptor-like serine/threonine-protein kinase SD2-5 [Triticum dicoccoides]|uniref:G-type lectin S-receptor-like serine/threonine-protein kinase SD2-5 n=1 Tax=Triticum dicoccoides TaxID=85692 RepID=UPI00188E7A76|nr:G-type lectin S-receptor-like serine/threonine-protein kinase SD2-5 [Triticum dicoccoides]